MYFPGISQPQYLVFANQLTNFLFQMYIPVKHIIILYQIAPFTANLHVLFTETLHHIRYCIIQHVVIQYFLAARYGFSQLPDYVD